MVVETTKSAPPPPPSKLNNSRRSRGEIPTVAVLPSVSAAAAAGPPQQPKPESFPLAERNKTPVGGRQHPPEPAIVSVTTAIKPVVKPAAAEQVVLINARELKL